MKTKSYELTYLASPDLSEEEIDALTNKLSDTFKNELITVSQTSKPSRVKLGYLINNKSDAFLTSIYFSAPENKIQKIKEIIKEEKDILRDVVIVKEEHKEKIKKPRNKEKVEFKEIDQKIDEILK